jgi:hypothetical protein
MFDLVWWGVKILHDIHLPIHCIFVIQSLQRDNVYNTDRKSKHAAQGNANLPAGLIDLAHPSKDGREHPPMSFMRRFQESVLCMVSL